MRVLNEIFKLNDFKEFVKRFIIINLVAIALALFWIGIVEYKFNIDYENDVVSDALASINDTFVELDCKNITEIDIRVKGKAAEFRYLYDNRIVVYLGIPEELPYKIKAADTVLKRLDSEDMTNMGELDVSNCHEDSNCYFNPVSILAPDSTAPNTTETSQEELEVPVEY